VATKHKRVVRPQIQPRVLPIDQAAEYVGLPQSTLATMAHKGFLPYMNYPLHFTRPSYKMFFDIRDLDQFIESNKEYIYETPERKKRLNVRNVNDVGNLLYSNYLRTTDRRKDYVVTNLPPTSDDLLQFILRSKSIAGLIEAANTIGNIGMRGLTPEMLVSVFVVGWYARDGATAEALDEVEAAVKALREAQPQSREAYLPD
jgi:hypothetical protein